MSRYTVHPLQTAKGDRPPSFQTYLRHLDGPKKVTFRRS